MANMNQETRCIAKNAMMEIFLVVMAALSGAESKPTTSEPAKRMRGVNARYEEMKEMTVIAMMRSTKHYACYEEMVKLAAQSETMVTMMMEMDEVVYVQQRVDTPAQGTQVSAFHLVETVMLTQEKHAMMKIIMMVMDEAAVEPLRLDMNAVDNLVPAT